MFIQSISARNWGATFHICSRRVSVEILLQTHDGAKIKTFRTETKSISDIKCQSFAPDNGIAYMAFWRSVQGSYKRVSLHLLSWLIFLHIASFNEVFYCLHQGNYSTAASQGVTTDMKTTVHLRLAFSLLGSFCKWVQVVHCSQKAKRTQDIHRNGKSLNY